MLDEGRAAPQAIGDRDGHGRGRVEVEHPQLGRHRGGGADHQRGPVARAAQLELGPVIGLLEQHRVLRRVGAEHVPAHLGATSEVVEPGVQQGRGVRGEHRVRPGAVHGLVHGAPGLDVGDHEAAAARGGLRPGEEPVVGGEGHAQHPAAVREEHALAGQGDAGDGHGDAGRAAHLLAVAHSRERGAVQRVRAVDVPPAPQQHGHRRVRRGLALQHLQQLRAQRGERGGEGVGVRVLRGEVVLHLLGADLPHPAEGLLGGVAEERAHDDARGGAGSDRGPVGSRRRAQGGGDESFDHRSGVPLERPSEEVVHRGGLGHRGRGGEVRSDQRRSGAT